MRLKKEGVFLEMNDVVLNKITTIERCINRIHKVYEGNPGNLSDLTKQDSIIMNIQRACEASIDLAMHLISERKLGVPKTNCEAFKILQEADIIEEGLAATLMHMIEFRNIAVRDYRVFELDIFEEILEKHVGEFRKFAEMILKIGR